MAQTTAQNSKAIRFWSGVLKIDWVNVWLLDNARAVINFLTAQIKAHNGYLPAKKKIENAEFTAELYEIDLDNIAKIDSHGVLANVASSPVNVTGEALGTGWVVGTPIKLANKNGAGTVVTSVTIDEDASALTDGTDYEVFVGADGYSYILPLTPQTGAITADYTYTPNASQKITFSDVAKLVSYYEVKFENTDENNKKFSITIPKAYSGEGLDFGFVADDAVDETMKVPITFRAFPDEDGVMIVIEDEQAV